jgi:hypothetical protein
MVSETALKFDNQMERLRGSAVSQPGTVRLRQSRPRGLSDDSPPRFR